LCAATISCAAMKLRYFGVAITAARPVAPSAGQNAYHGPLGDRACPQIDVYTLRP